MLWGRCSDSSRKPTFYRSIDQSVLMCKVDIVKVQTYNPIESLWQEMKRDHHRRHLSNLTEPEIPYKEERAKTSVCRCDFSDFE